jgi:hypothetical protein
MSNHHLLHAHFELLERVEGCPIGFRAILFRMPSSETALDFRVRSSTSLIAISALGNSPRRTKGSTTQMKPLIFMGDQALQRASQSAWNYAIHEHYTHKPHCAKQREPPSARPSRPPCKKPGVL